MFIRSLVRVHTRTFFIFNPGFKEIQSWKNNKTRAEKILSETKYKIRSYVLRDPSDFEQDQYLLAISYKTNIGIGHARILKTKNCIHLLMSKIGLNHLEACKNC